MPKRLLITGVNGFTGEHLVAAATEQGYQCHALQADLTDPQSLNAEIVRVQPSQVIHLAGISAVTHPDPLDFYRVNLMGTQNLLQALGQLVKRPTRILLASSANVYGHMAAGELSEDQLAKPVNHYAISKLGMELMAATFSPQLPIVLVRPFNYTGVGHDDRFVIPKIVDHFQRKAPVIELGNLNVEREYNDVRTVCKAYLDLLNKGQLGEIYNLCSGRTVTINQVVSTLEEISGHRIEVKVNPQFLRANEIQKISGNPQKIEACIGQLKWPSLQETLGWMFNHATTTLKPQ